MRITVINTLISLSLLLISFPLFSGCSGGTRQIASGSPAALSNQTKETNSPSDVEQININRTISCSIETPQDLALHYDSVELLSHTNEASGLSYIILHYQVSNAGKAPFSVTTDTFAIVTDDDTKYTPDQQAVRAVQEAGLVKDGESHELMTTRLQPGLSTHLFTAFILPTSILSKNLTLLGPGNDSTLLRLPLPFGKSKSETESESSKSDNVSIEEGSDVNDDSPSSNIKEISEPANVLVAHFVNIANNDYMPAYDDFSDNWKSKLSYSEFVSSAQKTEWLLCNRTQNCVLTDRMLDQDHAEVDLDMSGFSSDEDIVRFSLTRIDGSWKITKGKKVKNKNKN